jgi:hypothetical protein
MKNEIVLIYIGKGKGTLIGVPARDLTYEEAKKYNLVGLIASGLYVYNTKKDIPKEYYSDLGMEEKPKKKHSKKKESE